MTNPWLALCLVLVLILPAAAEDQKDKPEWTVKQLFEHYNQIPGDQTHGKRLTAEEAKKIHEDKAVKHTEETQVGPRDAGSVRFYYDTAKGQYWARRVNHHNPSDPDWTAGPFELPKKK